MLQQLRCRPFGAARRPGQPARAHPRRGTACRAVASGAAVSDVLSWARTQGVTADKVQVSTDLATDRAVLVADKDAGAGEALVTVPEAAWVSTDAVRKSAIGAAVEGLEPWLQISLHLVEQRFGAAAAAASPYIKSLPASSDSPLFWSDEQLALLQGSQLLQSAVAYK
jgi:[ribulose-bisphosphate carboxylase]-lysine N-methyltransferase